jgi:quinol monooxygenase YgiN
MMGYVVTARWTAKEGEGARVRSAIEQLIEPSRAEPGNRFYQPSYDPDDPSVFFFFEIYDDEDGYKAHGESEHFQRLGFGEAIPLLESRERWFYRTIE